MTNNNWQELYLESVKSRAALEREIDELRSQVLEALKLRGQRDELLLRLSSMVGVMRNLCEYCEWSALDFPDIGKAELLIDKCEDSL
jgi:hypothetical protein